MPFTYSTETVPHLLSIVGPAGESYTFSYTTSQSVSSPFDSTQYGTTDFLQSVTVTGLGASHSFTYASGSGEMLSVTTPLGGTLGWTYASCPYAGPLSLREVRSRTMSATFTNTWNFTSGDSCNGSQTYHATTTLADVGAGTSKKYTAGSPVSGFVVPTVYEEFNHDGSENLRKSYGWIRDAASNVYANAITTALNPGASNAVQTTTTQQLDAYGNLSAMQVFGYGNSSNTPDRSYNYSYYVNGYIYNRLAAATVTANNTTITTASIAYDGTTCGALQDAGSVGMHDSTYNVSHTVRGNPTSVSKMGAYNCFAYTTTGIPYKAQDATGNTVNITPDSTYSLPTILTPNGNNNLATSLSYSSSWAVTSVTGPNGATSTTTYDSFGVDAGIKRPHFRRSCSQRKAAIGQEAVPTLYEILNSSLLELAVSDTIDGAPTAPAASDGMIAGRRVPYADRDTLVAHRHRLVG